MPAFPTVRREVSDGALKSEEHRSPKPRAPRACLVRPIGIASALTYFYRQIQGRSGLDTRSFRSTQPTTERNSRFPSTYGKQKEARRSSRPSSGCRALATGQAPNRSKSGPTGDIPTSYCDPIALYAHRSSSCSPLVTATNYGPFWRSRRPEPSGRRQRASGRAPDFRWSSWFVHCAAVSWIYRVAESPRPSCGSAACLVSARGGRRRYRRL